MAVHETGGDLLEELLGRLEVSVGVAVDIDEGADADGGSVKDGFTQGECMIGVGGVGDVGEEDVG